MIRTIFGAGVFGLAAFTASQLDALAQFIGAALGAFAAEYLQKSKDKDSIRKMVKEVVAEQFSHVSCFQKDKTNGPHPDC